MPVIRINTEDGSNTWATKYNRESKLRDEIEYVTATVTVDNCESGYALSDISAQVKVRGNYTLDYSKKPIRIKFDKKQSMLGLNEGQKFKNWVLLADWKDLSASNNTTAFYLGNVLLGSDGYYTSDYRNVEVYLNGEYWGVYLLVEQQEVKGEANEGRMSVPEVADFYTGTDVGYLIEWDGYYTDELAMPNGGDPTFTMDGSWGWGQPGYTLKSDIYYTDGTEWDGSYSKTSDQLSFIRSYINNVYKILYEAVRGNYYKFNSTYTGLLPASEYTSAEEAVSAAIALDSLVDIYILSEIACDADIGWSSFYMSVDMSETGEKKLIFEAPWDYDSAFGVRSGFVNSATGLYAATCSNPWLTVLVNETWFQTLVKEKWEKLYRYGVLSTALELIQTQSETYETYYAKSLTRWRERVDYGNGEVVSELNALKDPGTAQGYAAEYLYNWLYKRFNYLNRQWGDKTDVLGNDTESGEVDETIPEGAVAYKFEAEDGEYTGGISPRTNVSYASNNGYLGNLSGNAGATMTYKVTAEADTTAYLFMTVSKRAAEGIISDWFTIRVNGTQVTLPTRYVEACADGEEEWHTFISVKIAPVSLQAGENTIVFTVVGDCTNFDCFELYSSVKLS